MKVRQQLQEKGLVCEEWGGKTMFVDVSALTKQGVDKLLETILLQAEIMELKANPNRRAKGNVIESGLEPGGPTATVLVRKGTLRLGDIVICGQYYGKVRALDQRGRQTPQGSRPVRGGQAARLERRAGGRVWNSAWSRTKKKPATWPRNARMEARALGQEARAKVTLETLFATMTSTTAKVLKVVVKADTQGSVEAIVEALKKIESDKVSLEVIHSAVGTITESDVSLASASDAVILGFHTRIDNGVSDIAKREGVQIKLYAIIYELIDQVKEAHGRPAGPGAQGRGRRLRRSAQDFRAFQGRARGRLHGHHRPHRPRQGPRHAPQGPHLRGRHPDRCAGSRTRSTKCAPAWNAASASRASVIFRSATPSSATPSSASRPNFDSANGF